MKNAPFHTAHAVPCPKNYHWDGKSYVRAAGINARLFNWISALLSFYRANPQNIICGRLRVPEVQGMRDTS